MNPRAKGFTLIELIVAIGLFALVMTLASGGYLILIAANRQAQALSTGINNLSFALETMTRSIRTGGAYRCGAGDCPSGSPSFSFTAADGSAISYALSGGAIIEMVRGVSNPLTDPSVSVSSLTFYTSGTSPASAGDYAQPHITVVVSGSVSAGPGKTEPFTVETGATMRGSDI